MVAPPGCLYAVWEWSAGDLQDLARDSRLEDHRVQLVVLVLAEPDERDAQRPVPELAPRVRPGLGSRGRERAPVGVVQPPGGVAEDVLAPKGRDVGPAVDVSADDRGS